ncbi:MAG: hypothetical protein RSE97_06290, partial [Oscillospiraceae bacterium]
CRPKILLHGKRTIGRGTGDDGTGACAYKARRFRSRSRDCASKARSFRARARACAHWARRIRARAWGRGL